MVSILNKLVTTPWTKISNGCLGRRSGINQTLALLKGENGRVRGRVFSYARSSPACAIPDSSPKLEDPRKRPILLVAHSNNSARCERGVPFSGGFGAKAERVEMQTY